MDEYGEVKGEENYPKLIVFLELSKHFILVMSYTWKYELFISINVREHKIYEEHPARFEGESSKNLKEEFTVSVKDVIFIIMWDMILYVTWKGHLFYCRSRQYTTLTDHLFYCRSRWYITHRVHLFYCRSRRYTTWRVILVYYQWRRYHYPEGTQKIIMLLDWSIIFIWYQGWHQELIFMHCESIFMHRERSCIVSQYSCIPEDHASRVNNHALQKIMHHERSCIAS